MAVTSDLNGFDTGPMFKWSQPATFEVKRDQLVAYAAATNDPVPSHRAGDVASPVFNVVPAFRVIAPLTLNMPPETVRMNGLHGEQDFRFHQPMTPGMTLTSRAMPIGITPRSTGVLITVKGETTADGEPVVDQFVTVFIRGAKIDSAMGEPPPTHQLDATQLSDSPIVEETRAFDSDQTLRYRDASGDDMPIHVDDAAAHAYGLPGIILHGNCTLAMAMQTVLSAAADNDVSRLRRLAVRFSDIVQPHEHITTRVWRSNSSDGSVFKFETALDDGRICLRDGLVEVAG